LNGATPHTAAPIPREHLFLLGIFTAGLIWSVNHPKDLFTWFLETVPALIAVVVVIVSYRRFRLTTLVYTLLCLHSIILMIGGHYTYAEMPLFSWLRDEFGLARNYYDRVGTFCSGIHSRHGVSGTPAPAVRMLQQGRLWFVVIVSFSLSISALYEFFEWWVALAIGENADAFLATQGDVWDTQWDMFLAMCGAVCALLILSKLHDRQIRSARS
jgi:putative membrane protein